MITGDVRKSGCNPIMAHDPKFIIDCNSLLDYYPEGTECKIKCEIGYKLEGSPVRICINGSWSDTAASCKGKFSRFYE